MKHTAFLMATVFVTAPLAAQHRDAMGHGHMMDMEGSMMREMGPAMMKVMFYTPQHLLARKDALALSGDQVARLTALSSATAAARDAAMAEAAAHMKQLDQAVGAAKPDTAALKTHFEAAHAAMGKAHWLSLAAAAQAKGMLNDAQREKLAVWADSMQAWTQQHKEMMRPSTPH